MEIKEYSADALILLAQSGDGDAMEELCKNNAGLVHMLARRFAGRGVEYEDLIQIGSVGLVKAIKRFDTGKNLALSTYAVPVILGEIRRYFRDTGSIKISRHIKETASRCMRAREKLSTEIGREPTVSEIAAACGIDAEAVEEALEAMRPTLSLDGKPADDEPSAEFTVGYDLSDKLIENIALKEALNTLGAKERTIVAHRFFMSKTQAETAKSLGVSQVQVSRAERQIIEKLKAYFCVTG